MKGDTKLVAHLNKILANELIAINQYFLHAKMFKNWGLKELAEHSHHESIDEMKHADRLIERILFLEGLPNLQDLGKLNIGENTQEVFQCDLGLELRAIPDLKEAIAYALSVRDYATVELTDGANISALETVGQLRGTSTQVENAIRNLEDDSLSSDPRMNTQIAVLNKINAANIIALRSGQATNQLLTAMTENQIVNAKRQRDAEARAIRTHIRFVADAKAAMEAQAAGASDSMVKWRMP